MAYGAVMKTGLALHTALIVRFADADLRRQHNSMLLACANGLLSSVPLFYMLPPSNRESHCS